jgi:energy-coupling factor transport system ATP-binding protein
VSISELSHSVGYVFQNPDHQIFCSSVYEEVSFGIRQSLQLNETEISERVYKALEIVELQNVINQHPFKLGKGERQKLAIACVLAQKPDVLVIDEPTTGLDWEGIVKMMDMITSLNSQGHTIIFITHDLQLVADYASRIILLRDGTCIADDSPEVILKDESILLQAGLTPPPIVQFVKSLRTAGISVDCIKTRTLKQQLSEMLN